MGIFTFIETGIKDLVVIEPRVYGDERGFFLETYHRDSFYDGGVKVDFVQDNQSHSRKGVLRGMHFQVNHPQGKLVRVISGEVFDAAVDMRKDSPTFSKWFGILLSGDNKRMMYIPEGFAHGFYVVSEYADFLYKCTELYNAGDESGFRYDDARIAIDWPFCGVSPIVSEKDLALKSFNETIQRRKEEQK